MPAFLLFGAEDAAALAAATEGRDQIIEPREIIAGPFAGKWAASPNIAVDVAFVDLRDLIERGDERIVSIANAWPDA